MNRALVSLIIPIYNAESYLCNCINSVLKQTYNNIEIILVNDGSSDKSGLICEKYKAIDSRIKVIHQKNSGPSNARNKGILKSKGKYLQFIDADDHVELNMVEKLVSMHKNEINLVISGYYLNTFKKEKIVPDNEGVYTLLEFMGLFTELFNKDLINSPGNKLYNAKIIKENNVKFPVNIKNGEDLMFNIEYLQYCNRISLIKNPLYHYNILINQLSLMKGYKEYYFENRKKIFRSLSIFLEKYINQHTNLQGLLDKTYSDYIIASIVNVFHKKNQLNLKKKNEMLLCILEDKWVKENIEKIEKDKCRGIITRFLLKHELLLGISLYFHLGFIIKKLSLCKK